jgi:polyhydroxybutyrate depolymerase
VLSFHGTADEVVPYTGGGEVGAPAAADLAAAWRRRNGCEGGPVTTLANGDARCQAWRGCREGAEVALCTIEGGGHTWPGGHPVRSLGRTSRDLDATAVMLDFFERHPLPGAGRP